MTSRARNARVLREVRTRMRDLAAASHAIASAQHDTTQKALVSTQDQLEAYLDTAHLSLSAAQSVHDFDFVGYHVDGHKQAIAGADGKGRTGTVAAAHDGKDIVQKDHIRGNAKDEAAGNPEHGRADDIAAERMRDQAKHQASDETDRHLPVQRQAFLRRGIVHAAPIVIGRV